MRKLIIITGIFICLVSCKENTTSESSVHRKTVEITTPKHLILKPTKYISKFESFDLNYTDSLTRIFKIDSNSVCKINYNYFEDSVHIKQAIEGGFSLPITDSIKYIIFPGLNSPEGSSNVLIYKISFEDGYSKQDSDAYLLYDTIKDARLDNKIDELVSDFKLDFESLSISMEKYYN